MPNSLNHAVIELHNIARRVEQQLGRGNLSDDIRACADRLNALLTKEINAKDSQG